MSIGNDTSFKDWSEETKYAAWSRYAEWLLKYGDIPTSYVPWCERYETD